MKKILLATSAVALMAGAASAEVTLSGDARMGIISDFDNANLSWNEIEGETGFTSRARVKFTLSGETDTGLAFGASFRADNAGGPSIRNLYADPVAVGEAGEVFVAGTFGKLTMGDVDGAAQQAVGNVDGVGLTGLGDLNDAIYLSLGFGLTDPTAVYEYSTGAFTGYLSSTNPAGSANDVMAIGAKYATDTFTVSLGYETVSNADRDHIIVGATGTFGAVSLKANFGRASFGAVDADQYHLSATYTADALAITAFYSNEDDFAALGLNQVFGLGEAYGLGASYDLGGGAKVVGGYANNNIGGVDDDSFDLGLSFTF